MSNKVPKILKRSLNLTADGLFECKTCNEEFPSFQALGGHRANHKKKPHTQKFALGGHHYSCSICGKKFRIRNSLVTHLRRHRSANKKSSNTTNGSKGGDQDDQKNNGKEPIQKKQHLDVDLNLTPFKNFVENGVLIS
ncbi:zinc finger protein ZAT11-like [Impatiens glandulifera]|uniref:zinc finger protein ZAT11-like n=1 Tax=Impatiens glandulifera TaxID=253017 RepID=UPI001FB13ED2|nr:zinc finger protein ZAT11-like [Impatiens glandulifera]